IRIWFNFFASHVNCYASCDASEYLRNAVALGQFLAQLPVVFKDALACLAGSASPQAAESVRSFVTPLNDFYISGPVFPAFLLGCFLLTGTPPGTDAWMAPLAVQSLLSAFTCIFIALAAEHAFERKVGYAAGIMSVIYPAFIVNSGRLYTETFAA